MCIRDRWAAICSPLSSAAEKCLPQSSSSRKISLSENSSPSRRRDLGSKEELSRAPSREIFQSWDSNSYFPLSHPELCASQGINSTLDLAKFFQFRIPNPDQGGKLLAVGGPMIALVERGREMPSRIQVFTGNLAQRKLLSHPSLPAKPLSPKTVRGAGLCQRLPAVSYTHLRAH